MDFRIPLRCGLLSLEEAIKWGMRKWGLYVGNVAVSGKQPLQRSLAFMQMTWHRMNLPRPLEECRRGEKLDTSQQQL